MIEHEFNLENMKEVPETFGVYWIINGKTNQTYVGESYSLRNRLKTHYWGLNANKHSNKLMQSDYKKNSSEFKYKYQVIEIFSDNFEVQGDTLVKAENKAIQECFDLSIPLYNGYIPVENRYTEYNKKKPVIRVTPEEKEILAILRENPRLMNQVRNMISKS